MKLKSAARYFDTCPVYDAYTGALLFKAQTSTFLESSVEGSTSARRVISLDPDLVIPDHSCILALGQIWVTGASNPDEWGGSAIRKAYWTKLATDSLLMYSPGAILIGNNGIPLYGNKKFLRESINTQTDSELDPCWDIAVSTSTTIERGYFLKSGSTLFRVRMTYSDLDGFMTLQSDEVEEAITSIVVSTSSVYNPVTDSYGVSTTTVNGIILDYSKAYTKTAITDIKSEQGDVCCLIKSNLVTVKTGQQLDIQSGKFKGSWRILSALTELDVWKLHIRRL